MCALETSRDSLVHSAQTTIRNMSAPNLPPVPEAAAAASSKPRRLRTLVVMRHGARLDIALDEHESAKLLVREPQRHVSSSDVEASSTSSEAEDEAAADARLVKAASESQLPEHRKDRPTVLDVPWLDQETRRYDTPIIDLVLPARAARALSKSGALPAAAVVQQQNGDGQSTSTDVQHTQSQVTIVASPFRRALQTAGEVARQLHINQVYVHLGLGERMDKVSLCLIMTSCMASTHLVSRASN